MLCVAQLMYVGGIWGFHTHIEMWLDHADPTKSDAILYFTNLLSIIPPGALFGTLLTSGNQA